MLRVRVIDDRIVIDAVASAGVNVLKMRFGVIADARSGRLWRKHMPIHWLRVKPAQISLMDPAFVWSRCAVLEFRRDDDSR